ncbi:MAG: hypothetical protein IIA83_06635 [Thaumarchaeota archaeon]|nr:hypothetical protein [Nitrososphaerota archaeon]
MTLQEIKDWKITDNQKRLINQKLQFFSKKEASYMINIIDAIYRTRPSFKEKKPETTN